MALQVSLPHHNGLSQQSRTLRLELNWEVWTKPIVHQKKKINIATRGYNPIWKWVSWRCDTSAMETPQMSNTSGKFKFGRFWP